MDKQSILLGMREPSSSYELPEAWGKPIGNARRLKDINFSIADGKKL